MSSRSTNKRLQGVAIPSETLDLVFGALSHRVRRQILVVLHARGGSMTAGEIADRFKHSWPTTTRHLGVLESAGLLETRKSGRHRVYALRTNNSIAAAEWVLGWAAQPAEGLEKRKDWKQLPYAKMRNAIPPQTKGKKNPTPSKRKKRES